MSKPKFNWDRWDFDTDGDAYIIRKDICPSREDVPDFIVREDNLHEDCKQGIIDGGVREGWCKWQVRTDWEDGDGEPQGGYGVTMYEGVTLNICGKRKRGWFPVWIVRLGEWY